MFILYKLGIPNLPNFICIICIMKYVYSLEVGYILIYKPAVLPLCTEVVAGYQKPERVKMTLTRGHAPNPNTKNREPK